MYRHFLLFAFAFFLIFGMQQRLYAQTEPGYAGSQTCKACHSQEFSNWQSSHHAKAWTLPTESTVAGDFENAEFVHKGKKTRFFRDGDGFFIETTDISDGTKILEVVGVAGIEPLQQYLIETGNGHVQAFDVVWDRQKERWYHLYPEQDLPPGDGFHWTGPYKSWNARCAECHATGFQKNYDPRARAYSSVHAEIGVGCEACHGPAEAHVSKYSAPETFGPDTYAGTDESGFLFRFSDANAQTEIQQCAGCHARREPFQDGNPVPGTAFHDAYRLALLRDGLYHADGQILDEVYVYGSFLQSKMHEMGVRCSDCHKPHSGNLISEGNAVCTQCHSEAGNPRFPSLARKAYDDPAHHFHEAGSEGASCVACHMIERTYMGVDGRRDHSFRVPRPDLSARIQTPNACNDCHIDKSPEWAAGALESAFPQSAHRKPHFSEVFERTRAGARGFGADLTKIALHAGFPGIVRASALDLLRSRASTEDIDRITPLLDDSDPLVRAAAVRLQAGRPAADRISFLEKSLTDPVKSVRLSAARAMLGIPVTDDTLRQDVQQGMQEWQQSLSAKLDFPETHMVIGGTALTLRNPRAAVNAFAEATNLDPQLAEAWVMQVRLHLAANDYASAEFTLQKALNNIPDNPELLQLKRQFNQ
ncbi:multiheme c-type cytochrome [uncultured Roseibium sp.]|uniref:multiheme c-type cytochrome n=1 Tax=uncultured Roseibium sp. TaxID=1936171 RepID=UPI002639B189|nr:multiheme c-type cytochrome [uncultured Roseibium sp.]